MKTSVTRSPISGARFAFLGAVALSFAAVPSTAAEEKEKDKVEKPVTNDDVSAKDVAMTPLEDLNLEKDPIPPLLLAAQNDPYSIAGLKKCSQYTTAVEELNAVLGPDFDLENKDERNMTAGSVAKSVIGALIPFRGLIREVSGANKHAREFQDAIMAGVMRRAFLKGMGLKLGCKYPARPAGDKERAAYAAEKAAKEKAEEDKKKDKKKD